MPLLIIWLLFGVGCAIAASNKSRSVAGWLFLGMLLGPFGLLIILLLRPFPNHQNHGIQLPPGAGASPVR